MNPTFLIVDDEPSMQLLMRFYIEKYASMNGYSIVQVDNLADAQKNASKASIILLDLKLSDSSKEHTLAAVPELSRSAPVIVFTGFEDDKVEGSRLLRSACQEYGAYFAFFKTMINKESMPWIMLAIQGAIGHWCFTHKKN